MPTHLNPPWLLLTFCSAPLQSVKCAELIGFYVSPEVWCKLVLPAVRTSAGCHVTGTDQSSTVAVGPVQCTSCLQVLDGLIRGAKQDTVKQYMKVGMIHMEEMQVLTPLQVSIALIVAEVTNVLTLLGVLCTHRRLFSAS